MTTPTPLLRAKLTAAAVALATATSLLTASPATAATEPGRPTRQLAVALLSETSPAEPVFGVADSHLYNLGPEELTARLTELRNLGVTDLRIAVPWVYIEPAAGTYDWTKMDALVDTATALGFTLTGAVTATPTWAGIPLAGAPDPDTYAAFAGSVAARYGSQIDAYEVWNEPNGVIFYAPVNPAGYTRMLQAAYSAIKAANPDATVLAGTLGATGTVNGITLSPQQFLAQMYEAGAAGYFDALSYHPYHYTLPFSAGAGTANAPLDQVKALYDLMVANGDGDKKIWATEYGTATTPGWGVTQAEQAALLRDFLTAWSRLAYTGPAFVYTSHDAQTGILNHEYNFGLFTSDGRPKPAAQVLAELIAASGLGELPDYTAPRMSAARDLYLQIASVGFGLANQALVLPHAAIAVIYNLMPGPLRHAFTAVANAVSAVVAHVATAMTPVMEAALGLVIRALPQPAPAASSPEVDDDSQAPGSADAADDRDGAREATNDPSAATTTDVQPAGLSEEDDSLEELVDTTIPETVEEMSVDPTVVAQPPAVEETEPVADPADPGDPADPAEADTATGRDEPAGEAEAVSTDDAAEDTDTRTDADPDAQDSSGDDADTGTDADPDAQDSSGDDTDTPTGMRTSQARGEDSAVQSDRAPRRGPRTATAPSASRAATAGVDRADHRSTSKGSGRDNSNNRSGAGE